MLRGTPDQSTYPAARRSTAALMPLIVFALLLLLAGCDATSTVGTTPTDTPTTVATAQATAQATATTAPSACAPTAGTNVTVEDFSFTPASLTVKVGTTVTWTNTGGVTHTVTSNTGLFGCSVDPGAKVSVKFTQVGVYPYHCAIHPSLMKGTITVTAS